MTKRLRSALIWLLMLTLPAQSLAATVMLLCAPASSASVAAHHPQGTDSRDHGAGAAHEARPAASAHDPADLEHSRCSLCAFCVGAVALTTVFHSDSRVPAVEPSVLRPEQFIGFVADTPERPPRLILA